MANVPEQGRRLRCRGQVRLETNLQRTGFVRHTIAEQLELPQQRRDEKRQIIPALEAEYLSAGVTPGNEMGMTRIEILKAAGDFLLPMCFGVGINTRVQAAQQGTRHCRADLWRKLQGCFQQFGCFRTHVRSLPEAVGARKPVLHIDDSGWPRSIICSHGHGHHGERGKRLTGNWSTTATNTSTRLSLACSNPVNSPATQLKQDRLRRCH